MQDSVDIEKYKFLFEYQKNQFEEEVIRFRRLEEKALKYLSAITFAIGAYLFLVRWIINTIIPPSTIIEWLITVSIIFTFMCFISSWSLIFRAMKLSDIVKMPSDHNVIDFFKNNERDEVYLWFSKQYGEMVKEMEKIYEKKLTFVRKAYQDIEGTVWALCISVTLIFIKQWSN